MPACLGMQALNYNEAKKTISQISGKQKIYGKHFGQGKREFGV